MLIGIAIQEAQIPKNWGGDWGGGMCVWEWWGEKGGMSVGGGRRTRKLAGAVTWNCRVGWGGGRRIKSAASGNPEKQGNRAQEKHKTEEGLVTAI